MKEFEPKLKTQWFSKEFFSKYIYVMVVGVCILFGVSYGLTFFVQNKTVATGSVTTGNLTINLSSNEINAKGLIVPQNDQDGLSEYIKTITIENPSTVDGIVNITLTRTSGLEFADMRYALIVNGAIQEIDDFPLDGEILTTAILVSETIDVEIRLWPKTSYIGSETTFVGELEVDISYLGSRGSNLSNLNGKYVNFNCSNDICEVWQIVKVEDGRLVLTRQGDFEGADERENSYRYNSQIALDDDSLVTSVSTDNKNVYLLKTVKIDGGSGTLTNPYTLTNVALREKDKKPIAVITYKDGDEILGKQNIYYNETNYISQTLYNSAFIGWTDGTNMYNLGDTVSFTVDTILSVRKVAASEVSFDNQTTGFNCDDIQCALEELYSFAT